MDLSLFFAGTGGSVPSPRRGLPAMLVRSGGDRLLFDCGEGTQRQLMRSVGLADLDVRLHHALACRPLARPAGDAQDLRPARTRPAAGVYGPRGLRRLMDDTRFIYGRLPYELNVLELEPGAERSQLDGYVVAAVPVSHRNNIAYGYALVEDSRAGHLDAQLAEKLGVTPGPDFGRLAARGDRLRGGARAGDGARARGAQGRDLRRHLAVRGARDRRPRSGRARARGDIR